MFCYLKGIICYLFYRIVFLVKGVVLCVAMCTKTVRLFYIYVVLVCVSFLSFWGIIWIAALVGIKREINNIQTQPDLFGTIT